MSDFPCEIWGRALEFSTLPPQPGSGARAIFEGRVRNSNEGRSVRGLSYSAYERLAVAEGLRILEEARLRWPLLSARVVHRVGDLSIGDRAVLIEVESAHRSEAFAACSWILDEVKSRLPIWKKEHYVEGDSNWVACNHANLPSGHRDAHVTAGDREVHPGHPHQADHRQEHAPDHAPDHLPDPVHASKNMPPKTLFPWTEQSRREFESRQRLVGRFGDAGQEVLRAGSALIVGVGGLGCPAALQLALSGIGHLRLADDDSITISNLHRQSLYTPVDIGRPKVAVARERLLEHAPWLKVEARKEQFTLLNAAKLLEGIDVVLDCSDNFAAKYCIHDAARASGIPLVQASIWQSEGRLVSFDFRTRQTPCLRCLYPRQPDDACGMDCASAGVLPAVAATFGSLQAQEAINLLCGLRPSPAAGSEGQEAGNSVHAGVRQLVMDLVDMRVRTLAVPPRPGCSCMLATTPGSTAINSETEDSSRSLASSAPALPRALLPMEPIAGFAALVAFVQAESPSPRLIDVRELAEWRVEDAKLEQILGITLERIPLSAIQAGGYAALEAGAGSRQEAAIDSKGHTGQPRPVIFVCESGLRSQLVGRYLEHRPHHPRFYTLEGGLRQIRVQTSTDSG